MSLIEDHPHIVDPDGEPLLIHYQILFRSDDESLERSLRTGEACSIFGYRVWNSQKNEDICTSRLRVCLLGSYDRDGYRVVELMSRDERFRFRGRCNTNTDVPCGRFIRERLPPKPEPRPVVQCLMGGELITAAQAYPQRS